jgi:hypothetical protein
MTLKYKVKTVTNYNFNQNKINQKLLTINKIKGCGDLLKIQEDSETEDTDLLVAAQKLQQCLRNARKKLNVQLAISKNKKVIHITADREWKLFNQFIDDSSGLTKYNGVKSYQVDVELEYDRNKQQGIKDLVVEKQNEALAELREHRKQLKDIQYQERTFSVDGLPVSPKYKVYVGGGKGGQGRDAIYKDVLRGTEYKYYIPEISDNHFIHMEGGTFLELQQAKNLRKIFERKVPLTDAKHVGVEIEFVSKLDKYDLAKELQAENVQDFVCLVDDGSIRKVPGFEYAHELTIIAPEAMIHLVLQRALKAINKNGSSRVGGRCGLHVHLDMRHRDRSVVYHNLFKAQRILYAMNPRSRLDGIDSNGIKDTVYSKKVEWEDFDTAWAALNGGTSNSRYNGINLLALNKHQTIEIRIHSGSTNFEKISNWVKILTTIANMNVKVDTEAHKAETFCQYYGLDNELLEYIKQRITKFKDQNGKHITVEEAA